MANRPAEIFGYLIDNKTAEARRACEKHWCPFTERLCDKTSRSIVYPLGICTISRGDMFYAICPHRFEEKGSIEGIPLAEENIALHYFGELKNLVTFSEMKLPNYGTINFVIARHKPFKAEIDDFIPVELRAFSPENTARRFLAQVFDKGIVYENWGVKSYWVIQEYIYANLVKRYGLKQEGYSEEHASRFALQEFSSAGNKLSLQSTRIVSTSVDEIYRSMRSNSGLPNKGQFVAALNEKLKARLSLKFE